MSRKKRRHQDLEQGEVYTDPVKRISESGNGLIGIKGGYLNLGPIDSNYVGDVVQYEFLGGIDAKIIGRPPESPLENELTRNQNELLNGHL